MSIHNMNINSLVESFKSCLKRMLDIEFRYYECDDFIYGFEGCHLEVNEDTYWRGVKIGLQTAIELARTFNTNEK